jgi:hypothetical protein
MTVRYYAATFLLGISPQCFANQTGVATGDCSVVVNASGHAQVQVNNRCDSKRAAKLQKQLDALASNMAPRRLSDRQQASLADALTAAKPLRIKFISLRDEEAFRYATDFQDALRMGGVQIQWRDIGMSAPPTYGVELTLRADGVQLGDKGLMVKKAFEEAGISFVLKYRPQLETDAELFVGLRPAGPVR